MFKLKLIFKFHRMFCLYVKIIHLLFKKSVQKLLGAYFLCYMSRQLKINLDYSHIVFYRFIKILTTLNFTKDFLLYLFCKDFIKNNGKYSTVTYPQTHCLLEARQM